jgi:ankyrin repeat protein
MKKIVLALLAIVLLFGCAGNTQLHKSAFSGDLAIVKAEINSGKNVNNKDMAGQTPLMYAAGGGQLEVVKYLVENGADVNAQAKHPYSCGTALNYAAANNRIVVMEYLIEHGADVNAIISSIGGGTALFGAADVGHVEAVKFLLKNNADRSIKNSRGKTALDLAEMRNHKEVVRLLSVK